MASWVGALNISGNLWEWTSSLLMPYPYDSDDGREAAAAAHQGERVFAIGLGSAIDYLTDVGWETIHRHERELLTYATARISAVEGVRLVGTAANKASVVSFVMEGVHAHDIGTIVDQYGVAIRTGHHCTQPVMDFYGVPATARASFTFYNTKAEVDALVRGLAKAKEVFAGG